MSQANIPTTKLSNLSDIFVTNTAPSFAVGGIVTTDLGGIIDVGLSVTVQADGKILQTGGSDGNFALVRYNSDGSLDTGFDGDGKITINSGYGNSATVQADGKILLGGASTNNGNSNFVLVCYNADGSLDSSFDRDGKVTTDLGGYDYGESITVQADGKILLGGTSTEIDRGPSIFALVRYNPDGSLDTGFGGGIVTSAKGHGYSVTVQADGKILLGGSNKNFTLVRYNPDGSLDTGFGGDGIVTTSEGYGDSVTVQADGKILLSGSSNSDFALVRYNPDGSLDTGFGSDGKVTTDFAGYSVTVQADGKILLGGMSAFSWMSGYHSFGSMDFSFALARYNSNGSLDLSFSGDGIVTTVGGMGHSVTVQADGKILLGGTSTNYDFALVRYNPDGSLDNSFNPNPANTLNGKPTYYENGAAVVLDSAVQIYDAELAAQGNYNGASITLARHGGANAEDVFSSGGPLITLARQGSANTEDVFSGGSSLSFSGSDAVLSGVTLGTVSNSNGTLSINFNSNATQERVDTVLSLIAYRNTTDNPPVPSDLPSASVQIDWTFYDGNTGAQGMGAALTTTGSSIITISGNVNELRGTTGNDVMRRHNSGQIYGFAGNDSLHGSYGNDTLDGGKGNDTLNGRAGADSILGGAGADILSGGLGADIFKFNKAIETGITGSTRDSIIDFSHDQGDKINLTAIDANTALKGNAAFAAPTVGGVFSGVFANPGELYFDQSTNILYGNNDADNTADFSIMVIGVSGLAAADFVL